ncbi:helix-turn-helix transcriptional regulator [Halomonas sp. M4R5S39]|uniref:helix-turn-helix transcriptional regulator n=1 Tax=Halomonas kalidii TaxID=3043293 RepID=UPI0024A9B69B|nr:helix-turn-helix transcriptional regulator [Halomonas kalidii]MDI5984889.1 helix-turn-helix transcriptional regulator [Halomonas kalidii]
MKRNHDAITLRLTSGPVFVTQDEAVSLLGVHPRTAGRWARGQQTPSPARAALLAILSGQLVPFPGWQGFGFRVKRGPAPGRRPFAVLVGPDGREWLPDDLTAWRAVRGIG